MTSVFINNITDLKESNNTSFYKFIKNNLSKKISNLPNPFFLTDEEQLEYHIRKVGVMSMYYSEIKFFIKNFNIAESSEEKDTFSLEIYSPFELLKKNKHDINKTNGFIFIGDLPLLTNNSTFFINNSERVIINQIVRNPGVYFQRKTSFEKSTINIISVKGVCSQLNIQKKVKTEVDSILFKIFTDLTDLTLFFPMSDLVKITEIDKAEENLKPVDLSSLKNAINRSKDRENTFARAIHAIEKLLKFNKENSNTIPLPISSSKELQEIIKDGDNKSSFIKPDLFTIGEKGRKDLNLKLNLNLPSNQENLTNKDLLEIFKFSFSNEKHFDFEPNFNNYENRQVRTLDIFMDQILEKNLIHYRNVILIGYLSMHRKKNDQKVIAEKINASLDDIKSSFLESSVLQFADQVNSLSLLSQNRRLTVFGQNGIVKTNIPKNINNIQLDQYGRICPIETVDGKYAGLISSLALLSRINNLGEIEQPYTTKLNGDKEILSPLIFLTPDQEKFFFINFCSDSTFLEYSFSRKNVLLNKIKKNKINYSFCSPLQLFSLSIALIPFLEHNDLGRMQMAASMEKQAVPLLFSQSNIVGTNVEHLIANNTGYTIKSYSEGLITLSSSSIIECLDLYNQKIVYPLLKNIKLNQKALFFYKPAIWVGEKVFNGQIIAHGPGIEFEEVALGHNLTVSYMPWEGYNYEDGILISERLILDECLTSIHLFEYDTVESESFSIIGSKPLFAETNEKIVEIRYIKNPKTQKRDEKSEESSNKQNEQETNTPLNLIRVYVAKLKRIQIGDKLAGRFGNKGVITKILPVVDMPYINKGSRVDLIFNPLGIPSRMNLGQLFESILAFAGNKLSTKYKIIPFNEFTQKNTSEIIISQALKNLGKLTDVNWFYNSHLLGKFDLKDGQTGNYYDNCAVVGTSYILKLIHLISEKYHARNVGMYSGILKQPTEGKQKGGGQRFGEMETWALEAHGTIFTLQEMLTLKADSIISRINFTRMIDKKNNYFSLPKIDSSIGFLSFIRELNSIGVAVDLTKFKL